MSLSKSQYLRGLQCPKSLWLYTHKRELRDEADSQTVSLFNTGHTVGDYAKQLFPGGAEIAFTPDDFNGMIRKTADLINQGVDTIYEATFKEKGVFAMADILHRSGKTWNLYEVKASTSTKPYYIDDAAIQYYALRSAIKISKVFIIHINNQYDRKGKLDVGALFTVDDVTKAVLGKQTGIKSTLKRLNAMLKSDMPKMDIGPQCSDPYPCDFTGYCWQHIPERSIFNLYRMGESRKFELYEQGILKYEDIPDDCRLTEKQRVQVDSAINRTVSINQSVIQAFLDTLKYPISFLDFETFQHAVPRFDHQRPYMQMTFQYSLHVMTKTGQLSHAEYLGDENRDPRRKLTETMLNDLPRSGSIVAYNQSFEIARIRDLAKLYPDLRKPLLKLPGRFVDLLPPFRNLGYYHPDFNGSFSIKSVLPALFPDDAELDYKKLDIQNGGMAMDTFANLHLLKDRQQREQIRQDLLAYCHLDTLAMVRLWEKLREVTSGS